MKKPTIIIHTCPQRLWYVNDFLIPSLLEQKINDIYVVNDKHRIGNLLAFIKSLENPIDAYHLQDDVIICKDFAERTKKLDHGIVCGFSSNFFEPKQYIEGKTTAVHMGFSFPCIRIPAEVAEHFYKWFYDERTSKLYRDMIQTGKMDDLLFMEFLREERPEEPINNLNPSLVDHIDFLLGGSLVNKGREGKYKQARATFFNDPGLVTILQNQITLYQNQKGGKQ
jgi:hypothetical protein